MVDNERRAALALLHPISVLALVVWVLNDHWWKGAHGNALTGKLSDLAGLVVFPLLVAFVVARRSSRPVWWGIAVTTALFVAINVSDGAASVVSGALSLVMGPSRLTADPTDLLLLPVVAVPAHLWNTAALRRVRRNWARLVFAVGLGATVATSQPLYSSAPVEGSLVLSPDRPVAEVPVAVSLRNEFVEVAPLLEQDVLAATVGGGLVDVETTVVSTGAGQFVRFTLPPDVAGPVEVEWTFTASYYGTGPLFSREPVPQLLVGEARYESPSSPSGIWYPTHRDGAANAQNSGYWIEQRVGRISVTTDDPAAAFVLRRVDDRQPGEYRAAYEDDEITLGEPFSQPERCGGASTGCSFDVWVSSAAPESDRATGVELDVLNDPDARVEVEHIWLESDSFVTSLASRSVETKQTIDGTLRFDIVGLGDRDPRRSVVETFAARVFSTRMGDEEMSSDTRDVVLRRCCDPVGPLADDAFPIGDACCEVRLEGTLGQSNRPWPIETEVIVTVHWVGELWDGPDGIRVIEHPFDE